MTRRDLRAAAKALPACALLLIGADRLSAQANAHETHVVSVAGVWEITLTNGDQSFDWNVTFEQEGVTLSGFAESRGRVFPLEGSVDGHEITFYVTIDDPDHDEPLAFTGEIDGRSATGVMDPTGGMHPEALMDWYGERKDGS